MTKIIDETYPVLTSELAKGSLIVLGDKRPCKIVEYSISKTGKHGHAKASMVAIDIFDGRKYEDQNPTSHSSICPKVETSVYQMQGYDDDYVQYMDEDGNAGEIALPAYPEGYADQLKQAFDQADKDGVSLNITVMRSMGIEQIMSHRADKE